MINRDMMIDAISGLDTELLEWHETHRQTLQKKHRRAKILKIWISAACILLVLSILTVSLPLGAVMMYGAGNETLVQAVDRVLFPLDMNRDTTQSSPQVMIPWHNWPMTKALFDVLGGGEDGSFIEWLQQSGTGWPARLSEIFGDLLARMYDYYLRHSDKVQQEPATEESTKRDPNVLVDKQGVIYKIDGRICRVTGVSDLSVTEIIIPRQTHGYNVIAIEEHAFEGCTALKSVQISDKVQKIEANAFADCVALERVDVCDAISNLTKTVIYANALPEGIPICYLDQEIGVEGDPSQTYIHDGNFVYRKNVAGNLVYYTVVRAFIPESGVAKVPATVNGIEVRRIGEKAFSSISGIYSVELSKGITAIEESAFSHCTDLARIGLPQGLRSIGRYAFYSTGLLTITIPGSVIEIDSFALGQCRNLTKVVWPAGTKAVSSGCFSGCVSLTEVVLSDTVTEIGWSAFSDCTRLKELVVPQGLVQIGERAFDGCGISVLYYQGTAREWAGVSVADTQAPLNVKIVCSDGTECKLN